MSSRNTTLYSQTCRGKLYDKSNVLQERVTGPLRTALLRFGKISQRKGDFILCKATLENNLIGAMQLYAGLFIIDDRIQAVRGK